MMQAGARPQQRLPQLDVLRAVAIFLVFGNHMIVCPSETNIYVSRLTGFWNRGGWVGVDLFFVLSGFLISGLLFREYRRTADLNIPRFLVRRAFKIYPGFWVLILVTCFVALFINIGFYRRGLLGELLFVQNYFASLWEHTWSLAVEEHFYFGLCILFYFLLYRRKTPSETPFARIPYVFAIIAIACFAMRLLTETLLPFQYERNIEPTHLRIDSLFFGVFLSYLWHFKNLSENEFINRNKFALGIFGALLLLPAFVVQFKINPWIGVIGLPMFSLGSGLLLLSILKTDLSRVPLAKSIAYTGSLSYSIYLWHVPVLRWLPNVASSLVGKLNWFLYFAVTFVATMLIGALMAKVIEYPFLRIRNRYFPTLSPPLVQNLPPVTCQAEPRIATADLDAS